MAEKCTTIGGQAVIEGVMMRGKKIYALAVRNPEGEIVIEKKPVMSMNKGLFKLPIFRGMAAFVDSLVNGTKILMRSAEIAGEGWEDEELSPFEKWLMDKLKQHKIAHIREVCFATINKQHQLQYDLYDDTIPGMIDISEEDTPAFSLDGIQLKPADEPSSQLP